MTAALPLPATVNGLPLHPLVVHAVVVLVPLAIVGGIGISVWPAIRRHFGLLVLAGTFIALVAVPIATSSGEQFRNRLGAAQLVRQHQHYARFMLPFTAILFVLVALLMIVDLSRRLAPTPTPTPAAATTRFERSVGRVIPVRLRESPELLRRAQPILGVLTVVIALVLAYYCYKTGESGAKAVWQGR